jgi:PAS domain S-box-containing protein
MDLRTKTLVIFGIGIIVILTGFIVYSSVILQQSYKNIEIKELHENLGQVGSAIEYGLSDLDSTLRDWAEWDETYDFVENNNSAYIDENLNKDTYETLDLNFIILFNTSGGRVFAEGYNKTTDHLEPISPELMDTIVRDRPLFGFPSPGTSSSVKGLLFVGRQPVLVAAQPVLKSNGEGRAAGIMVIGRNIDNIQLERISRITGTSVAVIDPVTMQRDPVLRPIKTQLDAGIPDVIYPVSPNTIIGYVSFEELNVTPENYYIEVTEPRVIYQSGISTVLSFLFIVIVAMIAFGALGLFLIDRMVLSRISTITNDIGAIGSGDDNNRICEVSGNDELTQLSVEINRMLEQLSRARLRYKSIVEGLTEFICRFDTNGMVTFMNPAFESFSRHLLKSGENLSIFDIFHPVMSKEDFNAMLKPLTSGSPAISGEHEQLLDGEDHFITWTISGIFDRDGRLQECQFVGRDITGAKQTEAALQQVTKKLALLNYITFNNIKNAIFTLRGYLSLGKVHTTDNTFRQYLERAEESVGKIEESLNFAKQYQDLGLTTPQWQNVNRSFILGISHLDFSSIHRNVQIDGLEIYADPLLERVFFTLASNVLNHAETATEISLGYEIKNDGLYLFFGDNGVGITDENREKIFERGYGHQQGMELFLVREILGITGITIRETGKPGSGACFEIFVPKLAYRFSDTL